MSVTHTIKGSENLVMKTHQNCELLHYDFLYSYFMFIKGTFTNICYSVGN